METTGLTYINMENSHRDQKKEKGIFIMMCGWNKFVVALKKSALDEIEMDET